MDDLGGDVAIALFFLITYGYCRLTIMLAEKRKNRKWWEDL